MDTDDYHNVGEAVSPDDLAADAQPYLAAVQGNPHMELVETRRTPKGDVIVFDALVGVPPKSTSGIRSRERLAVEVVPGERPSLLILRRGFPATPHQNITAAGSPRTLCLSERLWSEDRSALTPERLLRQVTDWLERAVYGRLHLPGQPLEPFVFNHGEVIVDKDVLDVLPGELVIVRPGVDGKVFTAKPLKQGEEAGPEPWLLMPLETTPTDTLIIRDLPTDFGELAAILDPVGIDLVATTQEWTRRLAATGRSDLYDAKWLFLVRIPRIPLDDGDLDEERIALLLSGVTVGELGVSLNVLGNAGGTLAPILQAEVPEPTTLAVGTPVPLNPTLTMSRTQAQRMSGLETAADWSMSMTMVGVGALGSQVALSLARQGIGTWAYIDKDLLMPHNLTRHALLGVSVGQPKANHLAFCSQSVLESPSSFTGYREDIFEVAPDSDAGRRLSEAEFIFDFTTSRAALRHLADYPSDAIRIAGYLTASRRHLVLMCEGADRAIRIDDLDLEFSTACAADPILASVLTKGDESKVRYAGGCGDASVVLAGDVVTTLAGVATARTKSLLSNCESGIWLWELDPTGPEVRLLPVPSGKVDVFPIGGWEVRICESVVQRMYELRAERLGVETGGVLLGAFDVGRGVVYVTGVLPSPPDSVEWPTCYIRGVKGLFTAVKATESRSGGEVGYVGEWHSHPGTSCLPSEDDQKALADLTGMMGAEGLPGILAIVADGSMAIELKV